MWGRKSESYKIYLANRVSLTRLSSYVEGAADNIGFGTSRIVRYSWIYFHFKDADARQRISLTPSSRVMSGFEHFASTNN